MEKLILNCLVWGCSTIVVCIALFLKVHPVVTCVLCIPALLTWIIEDYN